MDRKTSNPDPTTSAPSPAPLPDQGDVTPPHGDVRLRPHGEETGLRRDLDEASRRSREVVNRQRNMSRTSSPPPADPDNDRPAE